MSLADQRRKRRRELESFYTDTNRQQAFFKFLESPKTTCPARNFLFWLDVEAYRLQRRLAKSGGVSMTRMNDYDVCRTIYEKYVKSGAAYPIFMPNYTKLDITSAMEQFTAAVRDQSGDPMALCPIGERVFDDAQNAVEVSLYRALTQFERELLQEKKAVDAVISTDAEGASLFITGSFRDLIHWFLLDCGDEKFVPEFSRFLCIYRMFEPPQILFECVAHCLRNPGQMTTNNFDKDLIVARTKSALKLWITSSFYCDIEGDRALLQKVLDCITFVEKEHDDRKIRPLFQKFLESPMEFPNPQPRVRDVDLARWSATEIAEQLTLIDAFQYYAMSPEELFAVGEAAGAPHMSALLARTQLVSSWVATCVLRAPKPGAMMKLFISVVEKMFSLNNYNGISALLQGIEHASVARLKKASKNLGKAEKEFLPEIRTLIEAKELYRKHLESLHDVPCIPLVGMHVQLMSEAYAKNVNKMQTEKGINLQPTRAVADVMFNFLRFQRFRYYEVSGQKVNEELYGQLLNVTALSDAELNELSMTLQPMDRRERKTLDSPPGSGGGGAAAQPRPATVLSRIVSPRALFGAKPKKFGAGASERMSTVRDTTTTRTQRSGSLGEDDEL